MVAAGCYVQAGAEKLEKDDAIDVIIGNNKKKDLLKILEQYRKTGEKSHNLIDINHTKEYEEMTISRTTEHTRAYIKVQDGCKSVLLLLHHSFCQRAGQKPGEKRRTGRGEASWLLLAAGRLC